jgi:radical SAM superfamily enzyme YgiQ (UPF0313 family)
MEQVQLVNAGLTKGYVRSLRTGAYPPLNIASLAAFVQARNPRINVELLDGEMLAGNEICRRVCADVVGISCNIMTYESALEIAESAAAKGSKVILGGPFPTSMPSTILKNRPFVDAVVAGCAKSRRGVPTQKIQLRWPLRSGRD